MTCATRKTIETIWRIESARLRGSLARLVRDVSVAEDLAQEALVAALERWPTDGIPENPYAWLVATARHRAIDLIRRNKMIERRHSTENEAPRDLATAVLAEPPDWEQGVGDDLLRLMVATCHPVLSMDARVALTLRLLGGLTTDEIARAFLLPEVTIAQRIVRAKRTLSAARVPFEVPSGTELSVRVAAVCEVVYLVFNEGYAATRGDDWMRPALCDEAMRLGRILAELVPKDAEVHGLLALMELHACRTRARLGPDAAPVLLMDQDRSRWDRLLLQRGLKRLAIAESLCRPLGPYTLQAAIAACHARARDASQTDWVRVVALYDGLVELSRSPVVELNRAVAVSMAFGPAAGLVLVDELAQGPALRNYHLMPTVRGDLLAKLGRLEAAASEFERAAAMTRNVRERALLVARAEACQRHL